jgi:excisionase family DNA binding protein
MPLDNPYTYTYPPCMPITYVSLADAAKDLGVAQSTLRHQIKNRKLAASKIGRGWFVQPHEVERYRSEHRRDAA